MALPPAVPMPVPLSGNSASGCWCPACLQAHIAGLPLPSSTSVPSK